MAIKGQYERERFLYGTVANDKTGDPIRTHAMKAEDMGNILFYWLTGGRSQVKLGDALPIERGGTGATTATKARLGIGVFVDTNNELVFGAKAVSLYDHAVLDHDGTIKPVMTKKAVGHYEITNITGFALNGFQFRIPRDEYGNILCTCVITFKDKVCTVKSYASKVASGKVVVDTAKPLDIPKGRCIDISVK